MTRKLLDLAVRFARFGAVLSLAATVTAMLVPGQDLPEDLPPDLALHAVGFGVPALLAVFAARKGHGPLIAVTLIAVAAVASEVAQALVPGRTVSALDIGADLLGIALGALFGRMLRLLLLAIAEAPRGQS
ncbi:MAG TPA: VanZ family protein [Alphaproteobacteria bacterium]|nr:VanZ family protein [Alphaproteobacteria bacterium]